MSHRREPRRLRLVGRAAPTATIAALRGGLRRRGAADWARIARNLEQTALQRKIEGHEITVRAIGWLQSAANEAWLEALVSFLSEGIS